MWRPSGADIDRFKQEVRDEAIGNVRALIAPQNFPCYDKCDRGLCPEYAAVIVTSGPYVDGPGYLISSFTLFWLVYVYKAEATATINALVVCPCIESQSP
jgi:hypothetical protein